MENQINMTAASSKENQAAMVTDPTSTTSPYSITFSKFPPELRLKIMKKVIPRARMVILIWNENKKVFETHSKPPLNLSISAEWRLEALKTYTLAFGGPGLPSTIPIDFSRDYIYLRNFGLTHESPTSLLDKLG